MSRARRASPLALLLTLILAAPAAGQERPEPPPMISAYLVVLAGELRVRDGPSLEATIVGAAARGEELCVLRYEGDWAEVVTPTLADRPGEPLRGFVSRGFVSERRAAPAELERMGCRPQEAPPHAEGARPRRADG